MDAKLEEELRLNGIVQSLRAVGESDDVYAVTGPEREIRLIAAEVITSLRIENERLKRCCIR